MRPIPQASSAVKSRRNGSIPEERREGHDFGEREPAVQDMRSPSRRTSSRLLISSAQGNVIQPNAETTWPDLARMKFLVALVSRATLPSIPLVQEAPLSFAPDGPSGLRPQHTKRRSSVIRRRARASPPRRGQQVLQRPGSWSRNVCEEGRQALSVEGWGNSGTPHSLLGRVTRDKNPHLHPTQLGFKTPNGCEVIVRSVRKWPSCNSAGDTGARSATTPAR